MRNLINILFVVCSIFLSSCYEETHRDFEYSATYFPRQFPLRTLIVEEENALKFEVGAVVAGIRPDNISDHKINFEIDPSLIIHYAQDHPEVTLLPESYYSLSNENQFDIKKADGTSWVVEIELDKEKFLNDSDAVNAVYALPFRIIGSTTDSISEGKDYSIFVVKFYNQYQGDYWLRGVDRKLDFDGNIVEEVVYRNDDEVVMGKEKLLFTVGRDKVRLDYIGNNDDPSGNYAMDLTVRESDGNSLLTSVNDTDIDELLGGGEYDKDENAFFLKYNYIDAENYYHEVYDSLYYINTQMQIETWRDAE